MRGVLYVNCLGYYLKLKTPLIGLKEKKKEKKEKKKKKKKKKKKMICSSYH